jgi:hypothetical protein
MAVMGNFGTAFIISPSGNNQTVLHSFGSYRDGCTLPRPLPTRGEPFTGRLSQAHATPMGGLIDVKGTLYGTTSAGGTQGYGTVFAFKR